MTSIIPFGSIQFQLNSFMSGKTKAVRDEESKRKYTRHSDNKQNSLMFAINYLQFANTL